LQLKAISERHWESFWTKELILGHLGASGGIVGVAQSAWFHDWDSRKPLGGQNIMMPFRGIVGTGHGGDNEFFLFDMVFYE